ncbi:MAG: ParA family protein [Acidobacteria bacterium]|nr:ParA family protein [Acidobacteriota bacterium]
MKCISLFSRKGGVGKTSITLSAAIQLAARGKKVAVIESDTQGAMLNHVLRLAQDWDKANDDFKLRLADQYGNVARWNNYLDASSNLGKVLSPLHVSPSVRPDIAELLRKNVHIAALSCAPKDLAKANNRFVMNEDGPNAYFARLNRCVEELHNEAFDYVFIDNTQGLSFAPGVSISWFLEAALREKYEKRNLTFHAWFVSGPGWFDISLLLYEINIYSEFIQNAHPTLIVNRGRRDWLRDVVGDEGTSMELPLGHLFPLKEMGTTQRAALSRRFFASPLWLAIMKEDAFGPMYEQFVCECNLNLALLPFSPAIEVATIAPQEHEGNGVERWSGIVDHMDQLVANVGCYEREFVEPAAACALSREDPTS